MSIQKVLKGYIKKGLRVHLISQAELKKLGLHRLSAHTRNECGQNFSNAGALGSHCSKVHRIVAVSTALATGSVCHVCMKDFHDTKRLQRHLNVVERCCRALQHGDCAGDGPFVKGVEHAWLVPRRVEGPRSFWATLNPERDESPDVELGGMNAATICARLQGYCIPNKFPPGKAVQLLITGFTLASVTWIP